MSFTPLFGIAELTKGRQCVETTSTRTCWSLTGTTIVNCRSHTGHFYDMLDLLKLILCSPSTQELESLFKKASSAIILMSSCLSQALANSDVRAIPVLDRRQCYTLALGFEVIGLFKIVESSSSSRICRRGSFRDAIKALGGLSHLQYLPLTQQPLRTSKYGYHHQKHLPYTLRRYGDEIRQSHSRRSPDVVLDQPQLGCV